ncbi:unnamed protein product [Caenorhabditis brenneri]
MRLLILLIAIITMANAIMYMGGDKSQKKRQGDWPLRFPQQPAGFDFKCKNRKFGIVTLPPAAPVQQIQRDVEVIETTPTVAPTTPSTTTIKPSTTTVKPISTTTLKQILTPQTKTTFWIRDPTTPHAPDTVMKGGAAYTVGPPQFVTVKIEAPSAPDQAIDPFGVPSGDLDFGFKTVGTPKAPRKVIDPDA